MAWNGSGTFTRTNGTNTGTEVWQDDEAEGTNILSSLHDAHDQDLANGINNCLAKDGQNSPTADIDFAGHGITDIASLSGLMTINGGRVIQRFDSFAAFVAATVDVEEVEVISFYSGWAATVAGPKGRMRLHHDTTTGGTPTAANTAAIIAALKAGQIVSADGKGWRVSVGQTLTAYSFGAKCDGTGDDSAAVQAFIYWQRFVNGGTTDIKTLRTLEVEGELRCTSPVFIPGNTHIKGVGGQYAKFTFVGCSGFVGFNHATRGDTGHAHYTGTGDQFFLIENLWLYGDGTANKYGVDFDELYFGYLDNLLISGFASAGYIKGQVGGLRNVRVSNYDTVGLDINGQSIAFDNVTSEKPDTFASTAFRVGNAGKAYAITFNNCHAEDVDNGIDLVDCDGADIRGFRHSNGSTAAATFGVRLQAGSAVVSASSFYNTAAQIINSHDTGMNVTAYNYVPLWMYGNNVSSGVYDYKLNLLKLIDSGSTNLLLHTTLNGLLGKLVVDDGTGALGVDGTNSVALRVNGVNAAILDGSVTAGQTRLRIYDVDNAQLERVTVGAADSGGAGYKVLRIPN